MKDGVLHQVTVNDRVFKYVVGETSTELSIPGGKTVTIPNWDIKGVRERWYRDEYVNAEVHYNMPKETEVVEYGIKQADVTRFVLEKIERDPDTYDPILQAEGANA